jgi:hypothetical protein
VRQVLRAKAGFIGNTLAITTKPPPREPNPSPRDRRVFVLFRRLFLFGLLATVGVVVALAIGVDIAARVVAQDQIASRAKSSTGAQSTSASINSFPFIYDLLVDGSSRSVTVHLRGVPIGPLTVDRVDVNVRDVHIDKARLLDHHKVRVTSISSATAGLTITASDITSATGVPVSISGNTVTASVAGVRIPVSVTVTGKDLLSFNVFGHRAVTFNLAGTPVVPDCPMQLTTQQSSLQLSCTISPVPTSLIAALSSRS